MTRAKHTHFAVMVALLTAGATARADCDPRPNASTCLTSDALWPKPGPQRFAYVTSPDVAAPGQFGIGLATTFQKRPIELHVAGPGPEGTTSPAIDNQVDTTLLMSFGVFRRLAAYVAVPATLHESGVGSSVVTGRAEPPSTTFRDPRLGAEVALVPPAEKRTIAITAYAEAQIPTHSTGDFAGEEGVVLSAAVAADARVARRFVFGAELGTRVRPVIQSFFGERQTTQALASVGAAVDVLPRGLLGFGLEAQSILGLGARVDVHDAEGGLTTSHARAVLGGEWLASARTELVSHTLSILAGGGGTLPAGGLVGIGTVRVVVGVAFTPAAAPPPPPPPPKNSCTALCAPEAFAVLPKSDERAIASGVEPFLGEVRACLARVGAERVRPSIGLRFGDGGALIDAPLDVGGYDDMPCVRELRTRLPAVHASRATAARCELRCD